MNNKDRTKIALTFLEACSECGFLQEYFISYRTPKISFYLHPFFRIKK